MNYESVLCHIQMIDCSTSAGYSEHPPQCILVTGSTAVTIHQCEMMIACWKVHHPIKRNDMLATCPDNSEESVLSPSK